MAIEYKDVPPLEQWKKDSSVALATRNKDQILVRIDELVDAIGRAADGGAWMYLATDLFFTLDYWLKIYKSNALMEKGREPALMALYKCVVNWLCFAFGCTVNVLPRELEYYFGRPMHAHGAKLDAALDCAKYLKRADVHKFKLFFKNGLIYQFPWWEPKAKFGQTKFVLANSSTASNDAVFDPNNYGYRRDWGGFAMSMGRDIYMAKHHCTKDFGENGNFYHSSYLAGQPVMCAGTMLIRDGIMQGVSTDSGHYRPTQQHVVNLLLTLTMHGINLNTIDVQDHGGILQCKGDEFLRNQGNWASALSRREANFTHIALSLQETSNFENTIKKLWDSGVSIGIFRDDMESRVFFAGICLPHYVSKTGEQPFQGISFVYALNALARALGRNPDIYETWCFDSWLKYMETNHVSDNSANRSNFAAWIAGTYSASGWTQDRVLLTLENAYKNKNLPWK
jgi:hypothetical protein